MARGKIELIADTKDAQKEFEQFNSVVTKSRESLKKLSKEMSSTMTDQGKTDAFNTAKESLAGLEAEYTRLYGRVEGSRKTWNEYSKVYEKMAQSGAFTAETMKSMEGEMNRLATIVNNSGSEIETTTKKTNTFGKKLLEVGKNILVFQTAIAVFRKALTGIKTFLTDSVKAAASAEQVFSKLSTVFDDFSTSALEASKTLADSLGVANSTAANSLSTIGDLLQAQGMSVSESLATATNWAKQLQDIIAFKDLNMSLEEFAQTFMSGAAGNLRNFRTFGSIVKESAVEARLASEGLDKLTGSELELAKMTARAEIALEQQANAIGATQREWETILSVNRRLEEQQKRLKENSGTMINEVLKPIKNWWTDILDSTNDAIEAQQKYLEISGKDKNTRRRTEDTTNSSELRATLMYAKELDGYKSLQDAEVLANAVIASNSTIEVLVEELKKLLITPSSELIASVVTKVDSYKKSQDNQKLTEARVASIASTIDKYNSFAESLLAISGVSFLTTDFNQSNRYAGSDTTANSYQQKIQNQITQDAVSAAESIMSATAETMGKALEASIGEFGSSELLTMQMESMRSLYEIQWNQFNKDGILTDEENQILADTVDKFKNLNTQLDNLTERNNIAETLADLEATIIERGNAKLAMQGGLNIQGTIYKASNNEEAKYYASLKKVIDSTVKKMKELGYSTEEIDEYINLETASRKEEIDALKKVTESTYALAEIWGENSAVGRVVGGFLDGTEVGQFVEGIIQTAMETQSIVATIIEAVLELIQRLDGWEEFLAAGEEALDIIASILQPLMPVLNILAQFVNSVLRALGPILFEIVKILGVALVAIETGISAIIGGIEKIIKVLTFGFVDLQNPMLIAMQQTASSMGLATANNSLEQGLIIMSSIASMEYTIVGTVKDIAEQNKDKIDAYTEMYQRGLITLSEYNSLISDAYGTNWDRVSAFEGGSYHNGTGGTTIIYSGDMHIVIDGTNLSAKQIADELERRTIAGNQTYA